MVRWPIGEDVSEDVISKHLKGRGYRHLKFISLKKDFNTKQTPDATIEQLCNKVELMCSKAQEIIMK